MSTKKATRGPMLELLARSRDKRLAIEGFLEWLEDEKKLTLCKWEGPLAQRDKYEPTTQTRDAIVFEFLGIDPAKLEEERRAMIDGLGDQ